ncbi:MAG: hypothetical protein RIQ33_477 [Bacteroidota bacterium]|jgi:hypothetical protein
MNKRYLLIVLILLSKINFASTSDSLKYAHRFFLYWGYNRSFYSNSNVHLKGNNFDLTFYQLKAKDKPYPFNLKNYIDPTSIWVPQYNYRVGYFINDKVSISIGLDHMKYVVDGTQTAVVSGSTVGANFSEQPKFDSVFSGKAMPLNGFMYLDHTNGLNLISLDIDYRSTIFKRKKIEINLKSGFGIAEMVTKSELHLMGYGVDNEFNLCGFGISSYQGIELVIGKHFFIRPQVRFGWIDLTGFLLNGRYDSGRGYQNFAFVDGMIVAGSYIGGKKLKNKFK